MKNIFNKQNLNYIIFFLLIIIFNISCKERKILSEKEIIKIANSRLKQYCIDENIDYKEFYFVSAIEFKEKKLWMVEYKSKSEPIHNVVFLIDKMGRINNISRMILDKEGNRVE